MTFSLLSIPAYADYAGGTGRVTGSFWDSTYEAYQSGSTTYNPGGIYGGGVSRSELSEAYGSYVDGLPANGTDSNGKLTISDGKWRLVENENYFNDGNFTSANGGCSYSGKILTSCSSRTTLGYVYCEIFPIAGLNRYYFDGATGLSSSLAGGYKNWALSLQGSYDGLTWSSISEISTTTSGADINMSKSFSTYDYDYTYWRLYSDIYSKDAISAGASKDFTRYAHIVYYPESDSPYVETYSSTTRPTSIIANYGIIGDDNTVTNIGTQTIVNEASDIYYNPVTNTSYDISGWSFDYSTRTYNITLVDDNSVTVEYADNSVNIVEGDTVYNVYYLVTTETAQGSCAHTYTCENTTAPTCILTGVNTYTCSLCGNVYTETVAATGHTWTVKQSVQTQYDEETGELLTEGYTIYECSVCGEQYKSTDGSSPPVSSGGSDSSGSTGEGSSGTFWEKIGTLFGTVADGVVSMIETAVGKLLDGLISLAQVIADKFNQVVDLVLGWMEEIPTLFSAFSDFMGAMFAWMPEEVVLLLTFGLAAVIFAAIIKRFLSK